jgi:hypothetical protein
MADLRVFELASAFHSHSPAMYPRFMSILQSSLSTFGSLASKVLKVIVDLSFRLPSQLRWIPWICLWLVIRTKANISASFIWFGMYMLAFVRTDSERELRVPNEALRCIEIHYVTIGPQGDDGPRVRTKYEDEPAITVQKLVSHAIDQGGVWDLPKMIFHPWHTVLRVNWYLSDPTDEELKQENFQKSSKEQRESGPHFGE